MAICLFLILASAGRYLFCQELCRWSHLLTPASHLVSAKGSPHPPNTPSLQYTTAAHAFVLSVKLCREHGFPYPTILLYTSLLIPPPLLLLLYYFPTKCSSFVPAPLLLSSHTMQHAEHSAQVSPVFHSNEVEVLADFISRPRWNWWFRKCQGNSDILQIHGLETM